ncbi:MAG TPA: BlaI/MecI/CopY family transcriptional regulator [Armatimonadota bacterium]|nr:BlaI/MecI/CopY family transcriptional regulator [Armatimonadota bacterium]
MESRRQFSPSEWQVLEYITARDPVTVREAAAHFAESHRWARTTTLTLMERLRRKGYLKRQKTDGVFRYAPAAPRAEMQKSLIRDFVGSALGGAVSPLLSFIGDEVQLSDHELEDLRQLVRRLDASAEGSEP